MDSKIMLDGRFRVFSDGRVYRIKNGVETPVKPTQTGEKKKYANVSYREDGKQKWIGVHRLVAMAFIPNPEGKPLVNHKDGDTLWNAVCNLEWVTHKENTRHAFDTGIINPFRGGKPCIYCGSLTKRDGRTCFSCDKSNVWWKINREDFIKNRLECGSWRGVPAKDRARKYLEIPREGLSDRDKRVLELAQHGKQQKDIAEELGLSALTVHKTLKRIATNHFGEVFK